MTRSPLLVIFLVGLAIGCGGEATRETTPLPPIGDRFDKGKELKANDVKGKDGKDKKPNPTIGWMPPGCAEPVVAEGCPLGHATPTRSHA